ncbi:MAG: rRNA adenine N-6-methyltransferase family protein [archaeon]|nr:rRNA adenine N-6-methyltransferase family protein [archaeon]
MEPSSEKQQHFLKNKKILEKEIRYANLKKTDNVIEIGAGDGRLTRLISPKVNSLVSYETDNSFKPILENLKLNNTKFIYDNALKYSWKNRNKIVSNIPYSLSEPVIMKAIKDEIKELTLIIGEKFASILKKKETKIGLITALYFNVNFIEKIDKEKFTPSPRVNSYLIQLKRKKPSEIELVLQSILEKESKTKNAIIKTLQNYGKTKREVRKMIEEMNLNIETLNKSTKTLSGKFIEKLKNKLKDFL